ncbi:MAG: transposase [Elusimicrobiota bacterium]|jgi:REP element-mobilizing transposase RayT
MGRPKRIQFPGACYYIELRGNNRQDIFLSNQDRRHFLNLLRQYRERYDLKVYAYCLMAGYVLLLIETAKPNLARFMQGFNTVYTKYFNSQHNTSGHVFQGRYVANVVDKDAWLPEMATHVHLECNRSGLSSKPWRYQWSSCSAYVEGEAAEPMVDSGPVLKRFGKTRFKQSVRYMHIIKEHVKAGTKSSFPLARGVYIGDDAFASKLEAQASGAAPAPAPASASEVMKIVSDVALSRGLDKEKILGRGQWRDVARARREAMHRLWRDARMGVTEISRLFSRTPSAVSQAIRMLEKGS